MRKLAGSPYSPLRIGLYTYSIELAPPKATHHIVKDCTNLVAILIVRANVISELLD